MIKKEGRFPVNARVDVDYSEGKPKVKFSYPMKNPKKEASKQATSFSLVFFLWFLIGFIPFVWVLTMQCYNFNYPDECDNFSLDKVNYNWTKTYQGDLDFSTNGSYKAVYGFNLTCDNKTINFDYGEYGFYAKQSIWKRLNLKRSWTIIWFYLSFFVSLFIMKFLTKFLVKKKWYRKWYPKAQAEGVIFKTKNKKYFRFYPKDIINNTALIPRFSNVELDYKTEGDFSDKLLKLRIREYRWQKINIKTGKKSKIKFDNCKWYAIFYFKEKPKNGYLEVIYQ